MVKKKKKASEKAIASTKMKVVDYKKLHLDQFISENKGKFLWMSFNEICFVRVKVLEGGDPNTYENTLVKIIKTPTWIKTTFGTHMSGKGLRREWNTVRPGSKVWTHFGSLYKTPNILKFVMEKQKEIMENILASKKQLEFSQQSLDILKDVEKSFQKAPDFPKVVKK
jgi:hypothetical protein